MSIAALVGQRLAVPMQLCALQLITVKTLKCRATFCTVPDKTCIAKLCPENQSCVDECGGMYSCPNGTVQEKICPAGRTCYDPRSPGIECPATSYCANGTFSAPPPCPKKFYCPTPDKKLPCPNHHFCPGVRYTLLNAV